MHWSSFGTPLRHIKIFSTALKISSVFCITLKEFGCEVGTLFIKKGVRTFDLGLIHDFTFFFSKNKARMLGKL